MFPPCTGLFRERSRGFSNELQLSTRTMDTEVDVPNPSLLIIPGMYAEVTFALSQSRDVLSMPLQALGGTEAKRTVLMVDPDGKDRRASGGDRDGDVR